MERIDWTIQQTHGTFSGTAYYKDRVLTFLHSPIDVRDAFGKYYLRIERQSKQGKTLSEKTFIVNDLMEVFRIAECERTYWD